MIIHKLMYTFGSDLYDIIYKGPKLDHEKPAHILKILKFQRIF